MSKRFGRQQKRKMREQVAALGSRVMFLEERSCDWRPVENMRLIELSENKPFFGADPRTPFEPAYREHFLRRMDIDIEMRGDGFNPDRHVAVLGVAGQQACCYLNTDLIKRSDFRLLELVCRQVADRLVEHLKQSLMQGAK